MYYLSRLSDSNAIDLVELISVAMGSSFKVYIKDYLNALGDPKVFYYWLLFLETKYTNI